MAIRVRVYRNLHNNKWSVVNTKTGRVIMHADEIRLRGVQWRVQPAGNAPDEPIDSSYFAEFTSGGYAYVSCEGC